MSVHAAASPRRGFPFIFILVMVDTLSFGIVIPVLPHLIVSMTGGSIARAATWISVFGSLFMLMQFLFAPVQGVLSDRYGRRVVVLASSLGLAFDFALMAWAPKLWVMLLGRLVSGICTASFSTGNAYVADIVEDKDRAKYFGLLGMAIGIGFISGPALGGFLSDLHPRLPFVVAGGMALFNFLYGLLILPESLAPELRSRTIQWRQANPLGALSMLKQHPRVLGLALFFFLLNFAQFSLISTQVLYTDYRFGWSARQVGYLLAGMGLCSGLVQAVLVSAWLPILGERKLMLLGVCLGVLGYLLLGLSSWQWLYLLGVPFLCLGQLAEPPAQALMTSQVAQDEQGRLQGALTSLSSLAGIFGPMLFANTFRFFISDKLSFSLPGAAFLLAAALLAGALLFAERATRLPLVLKESGSPESATIPFESTAFRCHSDAGPARPPGQWATERKP